MKIASNVTDKTLSTVLSKFAEEKVLMLECNIAYIANWYFEKKKEKLRVVQYLNYSNYVSFSPWDWDKIGINLGTKHVVY